MKTATVCFLIHDDEICLGLKKRGFGVNKYNGFGGKVGDKPEFKDETVEKSAEREGQEEFGITIKSLQKVGEICFNFPQNEGWGQIVHVFLCTNWEGNPQESEEMKPVWFKISDIPYGQMWDDDKYWLPKVLNGKKIKASFEFDKEGTVTKQEIQVIRATKSPKENRF